MNQLILASGSPRRHEILAQLGYSFTIEVSDIEETILPEWSAAQAVQELASQKALTISKKHPNYYVLGSDTIVSLAGKFLGKPQNEKEALITLRQLSGNTHSVYTGLALAYQGKIIKKDYDTTLVHFRTLTDEEISNYILTKDPMDKAGSYGIQGPGAKFIQGIEGCFYNVMGLPSVKTQDILKEILWTKK